MTVAAEPVASQSAMKRCLDNVGRSVLMLIQPARIRSETHWLPRQWAVAAAIVVALFLLGMIFLDARTTIAVLHLPHWVASSFDAITDYGKSGYFLWPLGLIFLALCAVHPLSSRIQQRVLAAIVVRVGFLFVAIAIPSLFDTVIKRLIGRARPMVDSGHPDPYLFSPFIWRNDYASLPSGHATTAFAVLVAFSTLWPRTRTIFLIYAVLIALSRVVVTAHYPTDVAIGALVGTIGALMVRRWFGLRRLGCSLQPDGSVHHYPGPSFKRIKAVARALLAD
jgi:membrane-associated phospholipid phosphatase